ncbi:uncharacterized protein LOC124643770 [Helicoverpa zea]|uniref:uncharacterized protein LOC124643770 n=1 Tax=Helicoverpa zea TaxID=7113 RepID=UPI001F5ACF3D|nr:uncharacterized protein LOC124643770 [Helicoverpa zea]
MTSYDKYLGLPLEQFERMSRNYELFQETCNDLTKEPVRVYSPLTKKSMDELYLNREVSKDLQKKKEEDMKKAAQAAQEASEAKEEKEGSEEKQEENPETEK